MQAVFVGKAEVVAEQRRASGARRFQHRAEVCEHTTARDFGDQKVATRSGGLASLRDGFGTSSGGYATKPEVLPCGRIPRKLLTRRCQSSPIYREFEPCRILDG